MKQLVAWMHIIEVKDKKLLDSPITESKTNQKSSTKSVGNKENKYERHFEDGKHRNSYHNLVITSLGPNTCLSLILAIYIFQKSLLLGFLSNNTLCLISLILT